MASDRIKRYRQAKEIAWTALERRQKARVAFIAAECGGDKALRREVMWLIEAAEDPAGDTLSEDFQTVTRLAIDEVCLEVPLPRNYRLLRLLDEGGMGVVYLAERIDGNLRQQVALKLLHLTSVPDGALARRFVTERRILGALSHPNIAHLVDGGLTAEGRPFLAMEYVDGERIDLWCDRHELSLRERIRLFMKVCAAVDYAHRHMVIHRDIKPANILVTSAGEPKLLDFGIARLLDEDAATALTETGRRALTMAYASPEQIEGHTLSTATDVYSLGVVLYQLLAGVRPFDHLESTHLLPGAIISGDMPPPSRQARARSFHQSEEDGIVKALSSSMRRIPRDVDAIVLKALRREPAQRYASVKELFEDLDRFLSSRPVLARRGHWLYYSRRFVWRHRWGVAAMLVLTCLLGAFILDREAQLEKIAQERDRARAVTEFMNELFVNAESLPSRGNEVTVREMLDRGAEELTGLDGLSPNLKGSMLLATGRAYNALGLGEQALPLLEQARHLLGSAIGSEEQVLIAVEIASAYSQSGRAAASIHAYEEAIGFLSTAPGDHSEEIVRLELHKLRNHANVLDIPAFETVARVNEILSELQSLSAPHDELLLQAQLSLTAAYLAQNAGKAALEAAETAVSISEQLYGQEDLRSLESRYALATAMILHAPDRAPPMFEVLIDDYERLIGPSHTLANRIGNYGAALGRLGRREEAIAAFERAVRMVMDTVGKDHYMYRVSNLNLAYLYLDEGNAEQAESIIRYLLPSLAEQAQIHQGIDATYYVNALTTLADASAHQGKLEAAERYYVEADEVSRQAGQYALPTLRTAILEGLADTRLKLTMYQEVRVVLDFLDALHKEHALSSGHPDLIRAATLRLKLLNATGEHMTAYHLADRIHADACKAGEISEAAFEELRRGWTDAYSKLTTKDLEAPLSRCNSTSLVEAPAA